ncbi:expressed protein [Phakopsora pachyrhizi]|uniref:Expressed protein n=1 Tax=Phakopsora pachyrhizi TaxID=170000 RepID=A0AAV0BV37_PHAPC|nr:expressed protein [Phakopsora pachyrhizi]
MEMIAGTRLNHSTPSSSSETIAQRLQRFRAEDIRHQANLSRAIRGLSTSLRITESDQTISLSSSNDSGKIPIGYLSHQHSLFKAFDDHRQGISPRKRTTAAPGPASPASWHSDSKEVAETFGDDLFLSLSPGSLNKSSSQILRLRRLILSSSQAVCRGLGSLEIRSLQDACLRVLTLDISNIGEGASLSLLQDLNDNQKTRLLEIASEWCPLSDASFEAIFNSNDKNVTIEDQLEARGDYVGDTEIEEVEDWEDHLDNLESVRSNMTDLELSFSSVTFQTLCNWLFDLDLYKRGGGGAKDHRARESREEEERIFKSSLRIEDFGLLQVPHLTTLRLDNSRSLTISDQLLQLLSRLPLTDLSLASQSIHPQLSKHSILSKLSSVTTGLETLNLSYNPSWVALGSLVDSSKTFSASMGLVSNQSGRGDSKRFGLQGIDWTRSWPKLRVLGLIGCFDFDSLSLQQQVQHLIELRASKSSQSGGCHCDQSRPKTKPSYRSSKATLGSYSSYLVCEGCGDDYIEEERRVLKSRMERLVEKRYSGGCGGKFITFIV